VVDWVVDCCLPFVVVEQKSFQIILEAHGNKYAIQNADTLRDYVMTQSKTDLIVLKSELSIDYTTIFLSFDR